MHVRVIVAGLTAGLLLAVAGGAGAQTPSPPATATPVPAAPVPAAPVPAAPAPAAPVPAAPSLPGGCVVTSAGLHCPQLPPGCLVTSAGLQCPQLPPGCLVTSAGLQCPPAGGVESETAPSTPTPTPTPAKKPRRRVLPDRGRAAPVEATTAAPPAPLPFTGAEPLPLVAVGAVLLGAGLALRRRSAPS